MQFADSYFCLRQNCRVYDELRCGFSTVKKVEKKLNQRLNVVKAELIGSCHVKYLNEDVCSFKWLLVGKNEGIF